MIFLLLSTIDDINTKNIIEHYYNNYLQDMFKMAYSILHNTHDAEDAVHSAFVGIAKNAQVLCRISEQDGKCYCIKSAKNMALNIAAKNGRMSSVAEIHDYQLTSSDTPFEEVLNNAEYSDITVALNTIGDIYRDVLYMHYVLDLTVGQISVATGRRQSTVKQQLVRGKKALCNILSGGDHRNGKR